MAPAVRATSGYRTRSASATALDSLPLCNGAVWRGKQTSGQCSYDVEVRICGKDEKGDLCGTLTIRNLTPCLPKLVTFFDGEVVGDHHDLIDDKWGATDEDDEHHWTRFKHDLGIPNVHDLNADLPEDVVLMRLKERFITDAGNSDVSCASFDGFYYIAVKLNPAELEIKRAEEEEAEEDEYLMGGTNNISHNNRFMFRKQRARSPSTTVRPPVQSMLSVALQLARHEKNTRSLVRHNSYAAVVSGEGICPSAFDLDPLCKALVEVEEEEQEVQAVFDTPEPKTQAIGIVASPEMAAILAMSPPPPYSPPLDDFPPPSSPISAAMSPPRTNYFSRRRASSSASAPNSSGMRRSPSMYNRKLPSIQSAFSPPRRASSCFYNAKSGYSGPWAHAVMRGFYFSSSSDPYQELELHYVGNGLGMPLEESDAETGGGLDEWGEPVPTNNFAARCRENQRSYLLAQHRGAAITTML